MWPESAGIAQPRAVTYERRIGFLCLQISVVETIELEGEEQQRRRNCVDPLLHRLEEAADFRVGEITGMNQRRVADDPPALLLQPLVCFDSSAQRSP